MKRLLVALLLVLAFSVTVFAAPFLICDPQAGVISYNLDIDGAVINGILSQPDGSIYYNLAGMSAGPHIFKAQAIGQGGWPSDWSDPFDTTKPNSPLNLRVSLE